VPNFDPQYTYGASPPELSASGHANNLGATTPQQGLYTLYNGSLDSNNINIANISHNLVMFSENVIFHKHSWRSPIIVYDDTIGGEADAAASPCGVGVRFFLPCQMDAVRLDFSVFMSACRAAKLRRANSSGTPDKYAWSLNNSLQLFVQPFLDGSALAGKKIQFPRTLNAGVTTSLASASPGQVNHVTSLEQRTAQQYRNSHVITGMAAGLHTFELRVRLESPGAVFTLEGDARVGSVLGTFGKEESIGAVVHQRLTFGAGCVTVRAMGLNQP
tara:strand:- start:3128 stop:3949 length:822 start_codon:yes stop_codon:yes gene_type:complete